MLQNLMRKTVSVTRPTVTQDASLGQSKSYSTVYSSLPCDIQPASAELISLYNTKDMKVSHLIYTNQAVTIKADDRVIYGSRTFVVVACRDLIELNRVVEIACFEWIGG